MTRISLGRGRSPLEDALAERELREPRFEVTGEPITGARLNLMPPSVTLYRGHEPVEASTASKVWQAASLVSMSVSAAHGYLRNDGSFLAAWFWGMMGGAFPIAVPIVAFYQGFGQLDPELATKTTAPPAPDATP